MSGSVVNVTLGLLCRAATAQGQVGRVAKINDQIGTFVHLVWFVVHPFLPFRALWGSFSMIYHAHSMARWTPAIE